MIRPFFYKEEVKCEFEKLWGVGAIYMYMYMVIMVCILANKFQEGGGENAPLPTP